jgi:uncharacterized protein (TIGR02231 family)
VVRTGVSKKAAFAAPVVMEDAAKAMEAEEAVTAASFTEISEGQTNLEFIIKIPYDIPSDNKQYSINIQDNTLPATFEYYCVPKLDREAFLVAHITGWENYNLLPGEINLFFEGTYVGKSYLNVRNTNDTLDLSLGRDKGIIVTRVKMKDFTEQKTIGSNKRETRAWEITLRNNKKQSLDLHLEDQLPVSMNNDILVEPIEYSGGRYIQETGAITWKFRMEPSAEKKIRISYAVNPERPACIHRLINATSSDTISGWEPLLSAAPFPLSGWLNCSFLKPYAGACFNFTPSGSVPFYFHLK